MWTGKKMPPMKLALDPVNIILPRSQWEAAAMCFLQSGPIWMGCGAADCVELVIHRGTLTVCSGGRYLNQEASTWVVREENGSGTVSELVNRQKGDSAVKWFLISHTRNCLFIPYCLHVRLTLDLVRTGRAVSVMHRAFFPSLLWWLSPQNLPSAFILANPLQMDSFQSWTPYQLCCKWNGETVFHEM